MNPTNLAQNETYLLGLAALGKSVVVEKSDSRKHASKTEVDKDINKKAGFR